MARPKVKSNTTAKMEAEKLANEAVVENANTDEVVEEVKEDTKVIEPVEPIAESTAEDTENDEIKAMLSDIDTVVVNNASNNMASPSDGLDGKVREIKLQPTDRIVCQSIVRGKLIYESPINGSRWVFDDYGSTLSIPLSELESMSNSKPIILRQPKIIIKNADVIEYFNLGSVYRKVASFASLSNDLQSSDTEYARAKVKDLISVGMRDSVIAFARKSRVSGELTNINIINMLKAELKVDIG